MTTELVAQKKLLQHGESARTTRLGVDGYTRKRLHYYAVLITTNEKFGSRYYTEVSEERKNFFFICSTYYINGQ